MIPLLEPPILVDGALVHLVLKLSGEGQVRIVLKLCGERLSDAFVDRNVDGLGRRKRGQRPTAADAGMNEHFDAPARNAISLETEVIHEGKDAHA